ncbi:hypothetical protein HGRIS_007220 [Hohenbuehelia grisea]|uniref:UBA domain-containing protein n=1 Tax=Hohenbuehelia grisea TaxID=104357 RepID=A0ABR3JBU3_9AGAR
MSDAFADLWSTSAPKKPIPTSTPISRTGSRPLTPASASANTTAKLPADPFGSLLSGTLSNSGSNGKMTMADMAKKVENERKAKLGMNGNGQPSASSGAGSSGSLWDGLDSLGGTPKMVPSPQPNKGISLVDDDDDWGFGTPSVPAATATPPPKHEPPVTANDFDLLAQSPAAAKPHTTQSVWDALDSFNEPPRKSTPEQTADDPLDDWAFGTAPSKSAKAATPATLSRSDSPSNDFNFGDDDLFAANRSRERASARSVPQQSRAPSPPPHIIGQLVEMGFSPAKARSALTSTYTPQPELVSGTPSERRKARDAGWNVETAVAQLLGSVGGEGSREPPARAAGAYNDDDSDDDRGPPSRTRPPPRTRPPERGPSKPEPSSSQGDSSGDLLSQASEIGMSMFNKANAFWNTKGKEMKEKVVERVVKVYEETTGGEGSNSRGGSRTASAAGKTRPKWMQDEGQLSPVAPTHESRTAFRDDDDGDAQRSAPAFSDVPQVRKQKAAAAPPREAPVDLFSSDAPTAYVSPFRRGKPKPQETSTSSMPSVVTSSPSLSTRSLPRTATPKPKPKPRTVISCSPDALSRSGTAKEAGTAAFKLGQYGDAATAYTRAIDALPSGHLGRVPLYNNRALVRIRNGEVRGAVEDAERAISIICGAGEKAAGASSAAGDLGGMGFDELAEPTKSTASFTASSLYDPSTEAPPTRPEDGGGVDLGAAWLKGVHRRAEGLEALEKWKAALAEWEVLLSAGAWVPKGTRDDAVKGVTRCRGMVEGRGPAGSSAATSPSSAAPKPKPAAPRRPPPTVVSSKPSAGVTALRAANSQAEADAAEAHAMKDTIDSKLMAWKGGKETNIRALIASLDTVLWEEVGWKKVGMGELVSPNQVKVRYVRAIAKVHPDKVSF